MSSLKTNSFEIYHKPQNVTLLLPPNLMGSPPCNSRVNKDERVQVAANCGGWAEGLLFTC